MSEPQEPRAKRWTEADLEAHRQRVRDVLLGFLRERTRIDWFKHKMRWRLSRRYIWPGAPDGVRSVLDEKVDADPHVEAMLEHLRKRQSEIVAAIQAYNFALKRVMEDARGVPVEDFSEEERDELKLRRMTFQGVRDQLLWRGRQVTAETGPELIPELLSLRLAILNADARAEVFSDVAALLADEAADATGDMTALQRDTLALAIQLRLRCLDRYHVARLLAESYTEARRLMFFDRNLERFQERVREERKSPGSEPGRPDKIELLREVLSRQIGFLEELFPATAGTHERERAALRVTPADAARSDGGGT